MFLNFDPLMEEDWNFCHCNSQAQLCMTVSAEVNGLVFDQNEAGLTNRWQLFLLSFKSSFHLWTTNVLGIYCGVTKCLQFLKIKDFMNEKKSASQIAVVQQSPPSDVIKK